MSSNVFSFTFSHLPDQICLESTNVNVISSCYDLKQHHSPIYHSLVGHEEVLTKLTSRVLPDSRLFNFTVSELCTSQRTPNVLRKNWVGTLWLERKCYVKVNIVANWVGGSHSGSNETFSFVGHGMAYSVESKEEGRASLLYVASLNSNLKMEVIWCFETSAFCFNGMYRVIFYRIEILETHKELISLYCYIPTYSNICSLQNHWVSGFLCPEF
jgi:hypothetical protein